MPYLNLGGGRELFLGRGADGPSFPMVKLRLSSFHVVAGCSGPNATFHWQPMTDLKLLQWLLHSAYPALQLKQQNAVLLSNIRQDSIVS